MNNLGKSDWGVTDEVEAKDPYTLPGVPENLQAADVNKDAMTVSWDEPEDDGGAPISGYLLEKKSRISRKWSKVGKEMITDTTYRVRGLQEGQEYIYHVAAINAAGQGKFSEPSESTVARIPIGKWIKIQITQTYFIIVFYFSPTWYTRTGRQ